MSIVTLSHGDGGTAGRELVAGVFRAHLTDPRLDSLPDATHVNLAGKRIALTTDSFVVTPMFFAGGDIGKLAICGTVNDLAVSGAVPAYIAAAFVIEEGTSTETLHRIASSMAAAAAEARVAVVAGDTKVVGRGQADGVFITTSGVGVVPRRLDPGPHRVRSGDAILVSGPLGDHGATIMAARYGLTGGGAIPGDPAPAEDGQGQDLGLPASDCRSLRRLAWLLWRRCPGVRMMRDLTRGGLAAAMAEIAMVSGMDFLIEEDRVPVRPVTAGVARVLAVDPIDLACEGTLCAVVDSAEAANALELMRLDPYAQGAAVVGTVSGAGEAGTAPGPAAVRVAARSGRAMLLTPAGGRVAIGRGPAAPLPRIC